MTVSIINEHKFEDVEITVNTQSHGPQTFEGWGFPGTGLAFHKCITCGKGYRVTHLGSGLAMSRAHFKFQEAQDFLIKVITLDITDWNSLDLKKNNRAIAQAIRPLLTQYSFSDGCLYPEPDEE